MSDPGQEALTRADDLLEGAVRGDGPVVVVTAMPLTPVAREALAHRLGPGHIVRDIRDAGNTADVVLVPPVSGQLVGRLRNEFPGAKILVTELSDEEFALDLPGPVSRLMQSGVDGYFVAPNLDQLAAVTREVAHGGPVASLTTGTNTQASRALQARNDRGGSADPPTDCVMCSVIGESSQLVHRSLEVVAFPPLRPETAIHLLIVPIEHFGSLPELLRVAPELAGSATRLAGELAGEQGLDDWGYRLVWNHGRDTAQRISHPHLHLLGGQQLSPHLG